MKKRNVNTLLKLGLVIFLGLLLRLYLASGPYNNDIRWWWIPASDLFLNGQNIYTLAQKYFHSPIPFLILGYLRVFQETLQSVSYPFVLRSFLSVFDIITLIALVILAKHYSVSPIRTAALFFLNPVSIIITGFHGQMDPSSISFLLLGLALWTSVRKSRNQNILFGWISMTIGMLFKHLIVFQMFWFFLHYSKKRIGGLLLFLGSLVVFIGSIALYLRGSPVSALKDILSYQGGLLGVYGISYITYAICYPCYQSIFGMSVWNALSSTLLIMFLIFLVFYRPKDPIRGMLTTMLFFVTFSNGIGAQRLVLPIAFGALFPTKWFYFYSFIATLFLLGNWDELNILPFQAINWMTVWVSIVLWFSAELIATVPRIRSWYQRITSVVIES